MSDCATLWRIVLRPDTNPDGTSDIRILLNITDEDASSGRISGCIVRINAETVDFPIREGLCRKDPDNGETVMSFKLKYLARDYFMTGAIRFSGLKLIFVGSYCDLVSVAPPHAEIPDPGDTGTGGGSTT